MPTINCGFDDAAQGQALLAYHGLDVWVDIGFDKTYDPTKNAPPKPGISNVKALVDTGARESCIDSLLAAQLGLPAYDRRIIYGVNGALEVDFHIAQVHVPSLRLTIRGGFAAVPLQASGFKHQALVGRSFLSYVRLDYDGRIGRVTISTEK